ncbi:4-(cytidine 5'-diphospho)-2-C-methyl-D-erythritol kinase [bacterium]|nr:4-(cytidine 5'-diphospho)-2-C-methyl-D-erythritol kinase [bacterium]
MKTEKLEIMSYAKINLGLKIVRRRDDGYHDIETIFKAIGIHDVVSIEKNTRKTLTSNRSDVPIGDDNICMKALHALEKITGQTINASIHIEKTIPIGAGLGGGSSNGAGVLVGCNRLFRLNLDEKTLFELGASLGSDVPFFVGQLLGKGSTALGRGRGEILDFISWPLDEKILLVNPHIHISTPWAYQNYKTFLNERKQPDRIIRLSASLPFSFSMENDFEPLVFSQFPAVQSIRRTLESENAVLSRMSGSGSTVFGLFNPSADIDYLSEKFPEYFSTVCRFV